MILVTTVETTIGPKPTERVLDHPLLGKRTKAHVLLLWPDNLDLPIDKQNVKHKSAFYV